MVYLTVGSPVEGKDFYGRDELIKLIWERIVKTLLRALAKVDSISSRNLFNLYMDASNQKGNYEDFALLMNDLVRDFYAEFDPDNQTYCFASKVLKDWWLIHYRLFDEGV